MADTPTRLHPRTEGQQVTREPFRVVIGTGVYALEPLTIRRSKAWKAKLNDAVGGLLEVMDGDISSMSDVAPLVRQMVAGSDDLVLDLLGDYSPAIAAARDEIEDTATPAEAFDALVEIIRVEFPFFRGLTALQGEAK